MKGKRPYIFTTIVLILIILINTNYYLNSKWAILQSWMRMKIVTHGIKPEVKDGVPYYCSGDEVGNPNYINLYITKGDIEESKYFGQTKKYPLYIVKQGTVKSFSKIFNVNPKQVISGFDGATIYLNDETLSPSIIVHEYTHYKMNAFCFENNINILKIPLWFKEGVAEYISSPFYEDKYKNTKLTKVEPLNNLNDHKGVDKAISSGSDVYMQSFFAVKEIVKLKGQASIKEILINSKSKGFCNSLEKELGMDTSTFEARLLNSNNN